MVEVTTIQIKVDGSSAASQLAKLRSATNDADGSINKLGSTSKSAASSMSSSFGGMTKLAAGLGAALGTIVGSVNLVSTIQEFEKLRATLTTVMGGAAEGKKAFDLITDFTATTPFQVQEVTSAFLVLANQGLTPTRERLLALGNIAAGFGKDFTQLAEAVADAANGEFERLKEFGIKAKKEGENISFTFQGTTTVVKNSAEEITAYLEGLGNTKFGGAIEAQAKTINGVFSNITDNISAFALKIGDSGLTEALTNLGKTILEITGSSGGLAETLGKVLGGAVDFVNGALQVLIANGKEITAVLAGVATVTVAQGLLQMGNSAMGAVAGFRALGIAIAANPIGLIATGIAAAVAALVYFSDTSVTVGNTSATVGEIISAAWNMAKDYVVGALDYIKSGFSTLIDALSGVGDFFKNVVNTIIGIFVGMGTTIADIFTGLPTTVWNALSSVAEIVKAGLDLIMAPFTSENTVIEAMAKFRETFTNAISGAMTSGLSIAGENFKEALSTDYVGAIGSAAYNAGASIGSTLTSGFEERIVNMRETQARVAEEFATLGTAATTASGGVQTLSTATAETTQALANAAAQSEATRQAIDAAVISVNSETAALANNAAAATDSANAANQMADSHVQAYNNIANAATTAANAQVTASNTAINANTQVQNSLQQTAQASTNMASTVSSAFNGLGSSLDSLLGNFGVKTNGLLGNIERVISSVGNMSRVVSSAPSYSGGYSGGSSGGSVIGNVVSSVIGGGISKIFGGLFRANGGPVSANQGYVVGERGPEWFTPKQSGTIIPSVPNTAAQHVFAPNINVSLSGGVSREELNSVVRAISMSVNEQFEEFKSYG